MYAILINNPCKNLFKWTSSCKIRIHLSELATANTSVLIKMVKGKNIREKGKLKLNNCFKEIKDKSRVAISIDKGLNFPFQKRLQGRSGVVVGSQGKFKIVKLNDGNKEKSLIIHLAHLRRL